MEGFSLLKYWRGGGLGGGGASRRTGLSTLTESAAVADTTIVTEHRTVEIDEDDDNDDGPFFDLELSVVDEGAEEETVEKDNEKKKCQVKAQNNESSEDVDAGYDSNGTDSEEFDFALCSSPGDEPSDANAAQSPPEDLFFKGRLVSIEPNSSLQTKSPQFSVSLRKSATKFRVLLLKLKKSKLNTVEETGEVPKKQGGAGEEDEGEDEGEEEKGKNRKNKFFTVKFKVEEVPIVSLFTRDNNNSKSEKQPDGEESVPDEKKFSKEVMNKYLKKVKPLYVKVSRRYGEKLGFSGQLSSGDMKAVATPSLAAEKIKSPETNEKQGNNTLAGLRVVRKRLGKSKSASAAVAAAPSTPALSRRRDDSLLQAEDGIQSAILHCKRSFNGSRDFLVLPGSVRKENPRTVVE